MARVVNNKRLLTSLICAWLAILVAGEVVMAYMVGVDPLQSIDVIAVMMSFIAIVFDAVYAYVTKGIKYDRRVQDIINNSSDFQVLKGTKRQ